MLHCNDIDGLMVDWLYGELDSASSAKVSGHVQACARCQSEQAAFSRTRELFSALPESEPPSALTAMLVREAALSAKLAPAPRETEGAGIADWFARLFRPLMHPAAAAVMTVALVVGVAGTLYLRTGSDQFAEPSQGSEPTAVKSAVDEKAVASRVQAADQAPPAAPEPTPEGAEVAATLADGYAADILKEERQQELKRKREPKLANKKQAKKRRDVAPGSSADLDDGEQPLAIAGDGTGSGEAAFGYRGEKADSYVARKEVALVTAFKKDDCKEAAKIANDILEHDKRYYDNNTSELDAVKKCRHYVTNERKRRSAVARKRAASKSSKANKAKTKKGGKLNNAKAAPADSLEADTATE